MSVAIIQNGRMTLNLYGHIYYSTMYLTIDVESN